MFGYSFEQLLLGFILIGAVLWTIRLMNDAFLWMMRKYKWFRYRRPLEKRGEALLSKAREVGTVLLYKEKGGVITVCTPSVFSSGLEGKYVYMLNVRKADLDLQNQILERCTGISPAGISKIHFQTAIECLIKKEDSLNVPSISDPSVVSSAFAKQKILDLLTP